MSECVLTIPHRGTTKAADENSMQGLADLAARHPNRAEGDVCIGSLEGRDGTLLIWSREDSKKFCRISGLDAKKIGYLPWREVRDFMRRYSSPKNVSELNTTCLEKILPERPEGTGAHSGKPEETPSGTVIELREIQPKVFVWEEMRKATRR